jgi:carnitine monooxygenase subunit
MADRSSPGLDAAAGAALLEVARDTLANAEARTLRTEAGVMELEASQYTDSGRFEREKRLLFRRVPLMLAASCELREPGQYKALEVAGVPVLLARGDDGVVRAFLNVCSHRGAMLAEGCGHAARFVCPYHGWTFDARGALVGVAARRDFGEFDLAERALRRFPLLEHAGLIWVVLDPESRLDIGGFLSGFGGMLAGFGFESWHLVQSRVLRGANWKLAFDAHLEFYHLPVLHRNTFGPKISNKALYHYFGPHQRLTRPSETEGRTLPAHANLFAQRGRPESEWPTEALMTGEWIVFPHVSINSFYDGGRGVLISQVFPGERVGESFTVQTYLMAERPDEQARAAAAVLCNFLARVVNDEDLATSLKQQRALASGLLRSVCIGSNEGGLQHFHTWIDRILDTPDDALSDLFGRAEP